MGIEDLIKQARAYLLEADKTKEAVYLDAAQGIYDSCERHWRSPTKLFDEKMPPELRELSLELTIRHLTATLNKEPHDEYQREYQKKAFYERCAVFFELGKYGEALSDVDKAIELDPENRTYKEWHEMKRQGSPSEKRRPVISLYKSAHAIRGNILSLLCRTDDAVIALNRALELESTDVYALAWRAANFLRLGKFQEAISDASKVIERSRKKTVASNAYLVRSKALYSLNGTQDALPDANRAIELKPVSWFYSHRAVIFSSLGMLEEALADCNKAIELNPTNKLISTASLYIQRATYLSNLTKTEEALADCNKAIELDSTNAEVHKMRGWQLARLDRYDEAKKSLEEAIRLSPTCANPYAILGNVYLACGERDAAQKSYQAALEHYVNKTCDYTTSIAAVRAEHGLRALGASPTSTVEGTALGKKELCQRDIDGVKQDLQRAVDYAKRLPLNSA